MRIRTLLFCPADSERKIARALEAATDVIILDLEDSVSTSAKAAARSATARVLAARSSDLSLVVRINPKDTSWYFEDLAAVVPQKPSAIMLPKCNSPEHLLRLDHHLEAMETANQLPIGRIGILPLVTETAISLRSMDYRGITPRLRALVFGAEDLAADFGIAPRTVGGTFAAPIASARAAVLVAAAQAQVPAIDTPWPDPRDLAGLQSEITAAVHDGFAGKLCIHPNQLASVMKAFTPSPERVRWAESVCSLFVNNPGAGVLVLDGKMIDRPHVRLAEQILEAVADAH